MNCYLVRTSGLKQMRVRSAFTDAKLPVVPRELRAREAVAWLARKRMDRAKGPRFP